MISTTRLGYEGIHAGADVQANAATAAGTLGLKRRFLEVWEVADLEQRDKIIELAAKTKLPMMYPTRWWPEAGGLMGYGPSLSFRWRRTATFVDKILKGAKPADLPLEQPSELHLAINLKTATALGLTIPQSVLQRADEVIE